MTIKLAFFMSRATPLSRWAKLGVLERETAVYRHLSQQIDSLSIITSGGEEELAFQEQLPGIQILYNRWGLSPNVYSLLAPILHRHALREATIYKTNQLDGAWTAVLAAKLHRKPVIVRAGYLWAQGFARQQGEGIRLYLIKKLEDFSLSGANHIVLTSLEMKQIVVNTYGLSENTITVIPNYVDTQLFHPLPSIKRIRGQVCYVGRLYFRKNIDLLIKALSPLNATSLILIGKGEESGRLAELATTHNVNIRFLGQIPNQKLPHEINQSELFVLPSKFEGHPKALIEAMGCGTAVIGTDVEGINNVIKHNDTGLLCQPTVEGIRAAIQELLNDAVLRLKLGQNAHQFVLQHYALDNIVSHEIELYQSTITAYNRS